MSRSQADPFGLAAFDEPVHRFSLERMLTDARAFGLINASPVQRAVCRVLDGIPLGDLAAHPEVILAFGGLGALALLPLVRPAEMLLLCGIRGGKSLIAAACAVRAALTCDVSTLGPGEVPRASIVSLKLDIAQATWAHVSGRIGASPDLRALLIDKPRADSLLLRHPTGRAVEIKVVAGSRAAGSLVARWSAGVVFDEAPRMVGAEDGVVNLDEARQSVSGRLLPGAQILLAGSPWAPFGPVYELLAKHWAQPTDALVCVRATGPQMNPQWWTPERCADLKERDPDAFQVDVLCQFMAPGSTLLDSAELEACATLEDVPEPSELLSYVAVMDPATRGNAWALVILACIGDGRVMVALTRQWIGSTSRPLSPRTVLQEIAEILKPYRATAVDSDQWSADALRDLALNAGLYLRTHTITGQGRVEQFERVRAYVTDRRLAMPRDAALLRDLAAVRKRVTAQGVAIDLPQTADGRHCDFAAALALGLSLNLPEPDVPPPEVDYATKRKAELSRITAAQNRRRGIVMPP